MNGFFLSRGGHFFFFLFKTGDDTMERAIKTMPGAEECSRMGHFQKRYLSLLGISKLASNTFLRES